jgi:glutamine amidotransferase
MTAIVDYGMGNLRSVWKAFRHLGAEAHLTQDPQEVLGADRVVLPGVGAFRAWPTWKPGALSHPSVR